MAKSVPQNFVPSCMLHSKTMLKQNVMTPVSLYRLLSIQKVPLVALCYLEISVIPPLTESFHTASRPDLEWNVLLAPHHCSKSVMYVPDENGDEELDSELMSKIEDAGMECRYIVSSFRADSIA